MLWVVSNQGGPVSKNKKEKGEMGMKVIFHHHAING